jgi:hypothetical protein
VTSRNFCLLAPSTGLIAEFLRRWYGPGFRSQLHIAAEIDSIYFGLAILRTGLIHGAMICAQNAAQAAIEGRLPGGPSLRVVPLSTGFGVNRTANRVYDDSVGTLLLSTPRPARCMVLGGWVFGGAQVGGIGVRQIFCF